MLINSANKMGFKSIIVRGMPEDRVRAEINKVSKKTTVEDHEVDFTPQIVEFSVREEDPLSRVICEVAIFDKFTKNGINCEHLDVKQ